jgi:L-amino acid N-acyltransferase YncA
MIRSVTEGDAEAIQAIYAPIVRETIVSFETQPPSVMELQERFAKSHEWLVYEREGRVVGYAYAAPFHERAGYMWSVEVSIYLGADARGSGVGKELLSALLGRLKVRGFVNAFAGIALPNPASVRLFESFGFAAVARHRQVGFKLGGWHDVGWWQLQLNLPTNPPPKVTT